MANANFVVYNDAGIEQVSFGGRNLQCISKTSIPASSFTAISGPNSVTGWRAAFSVSGRTNPLVAIATDIAGASGAACYYGGNVYVGNGTSGASNPAPNAWVYLLDWGYPKASSNAGLELYDASGNLFFTTANAPVRIVGPLQVSGYTDPTSPPATRTPPAGRIYATLMCANYRSRYVGSKNVTTGDIIANDFLVSAAGGANGQTCSATSGGSGYATFIGSLPLPHGTPGGGPGTSMGGVGGLGSCLVLDVTGL